jgi:hypothetical protein
MNRRTILRATAALGAGALAGCVSSGDPGDGDGADGSPSDGPTDTPDGTTDPDSDPTDTPTDTPTPSDGIAVREARVSTVATGCVTDDRSAPRLTVDPDGPSVGLSGSFRTPNPCHRVTFESAEYDPDADELSLVLGVEPVDGTCASCVGMAEFDGVVSLEGGLPGSITLSHDGETLATATPGDPDGSGPEGTPSLVDSEFEVVDAGPGTTEDRVDVSFDPEAGRVVVGGTIPGSNGCMTAALGGAEYRPDEDALSVDVVTTRREGTEGQACTQAILGIDYEARFEFDGGLPETVSVSHDGDGVATGGYGSARGGDGD